MARPAVAATFASLVLMSVLVLADATVVTAQDNLASSSRLAQLEQRALLVERVAAGTLSIDLLEKVQAQLAATPAACGDLGGYALAAVASSSISRDESGVSLRASATAHGETGGTRPDNLTMVRPFEGGVAGSLDLRVTISMREQAGGGSVTLAREEVHTLHLPVRLDSAASLCASVDGGLASALARPGCNSTLEQAAFFGALPALTEAAAAQGFALTAGLAGGCPAGYWFRLAEEGVPGPTGSFDWTVAGSGTA